MAPSERPGLKDLMTKVQAGDREAYRELLGHIQPMLLAFFKGRLTDSGSAEDLCQTALLRIHLYRHTYNPSFKFESWMFTIGRNVLNDHYSDHEPVSALPADSETGDASNQPLNQLIAQSALSALGPEQVEILHLTKVVGLSVQETASVLGISIAAVKVRTHRALALLKSHLFKS